MRHTCVNQGVDHPLGAIACAFRLMDLWRYKSSRYSRMFLHRLVDEPDFQVEVGNNTGRVEVVHLLHILRMNFLWRFGFAAPPQCHQVSVQGERGFAPCARGTRSSLVQHLLQPSDPTLLHFFHVPHEANHHAIHVAFHVWLKWIVLLLCFEYVLLLRGRQGNRNANKLLELHHSAKNGCRCPAALFDVEKHIVDCRIPCHTSMQRAGNQIRYCIGWSHHAGSLAAHEGSMDGLVVFRTASSG
mmetsp:Transcript_36394/g.83989  ORF Transcript_36394/g.83989 Transcript_36394/m.83989 type:complete len:243 (-) Transcript_36394:402-1130(-)